MTAQGPAQGPVIALIAAVAENGIVGHNGDMPWRIKSELKYFREKTLGKPCIMGRKTFESLPGGALKNRLNIVVTRNAEFAAAGVVAAPSLDAALDIARAESLQTGANEIMITGGAEIWRQALPLATRLYLTAVHLHPAGDVSFPSFDRAQWREVWRAARTAQDGETADYTLTILEKNL